MASGKRLSDQHRAQQRKRSDRLEADLAAAYGQAWQRIRAELDTLLKQIAQDEASGLTPRRALLLGAGRLASLEQQVEAEIQVIADLTVRQLTDAQADAVLAGRIDSEDLIRTVLGQPPPGAAFQPAFPTEAFRELVGFSADGNPLGMLLATLGPEAAQHVRRELIAGLALGKNPNVVAGRARSALGGNLNRARTIARTEMLRAYRESSRQTYDANREVVKGWVWNAALDSRTCPVCISMHGTHFETQTMFASHAACRCGLLPTTKTWAELGFPGVPETRVELEPGESWFARQDETLQRRILGPAAHKAYLRNEIALSDLVAKTQSKRWGPGRRRRPLKEALAVAA